MSDRTVFVCTGVLLASEWWALEIAIMMGGLLPDAPLQLSAMAIYNSTNDLCFMVSNGMAVAVSTRQACTVTYAYQSLMHFNVAPMDQYVGMSNTSSLKVLPPFFYLRVLCMYICMQGRQQFLALHHACNLFFTVLLAANMMKCIAGWQMSWEQAILGQRTMSVIWASAWCLLRPAASVCPSSSSGAA